MPVGVLDCCPRQRSPRHSPAAASTATDRPLSAHLPTGVCLASGYGALFLFRHSRLNGSGDLDAWARRAVSAVRGAWADHVVAPLAGVRDELFNTFRRCVGCLAAKGRWLDWLCALLWMGSARDDAGALLRAGAHSDGRLRMHSVLYCVRSWYSLRLLPESPHIRRRPTIVSMDDYEADRSSLERMLGEFQVRGGGGVPGGGVQVGWGWSSRWGVQVGLAGWLDGWMVKAGWSQKGGLARKARWLVKANALAGAARAGVCSPGVHWLTHLPAAPSPLQRDYVKRRGAAAASRPPALPTAADALATATADAAAELAPAVPGGVLAGAGAGEERQLLEVRRRAAC